MEFETPRDRNGEFEPKIVSKKTIDVSGIEDKIISLYAKRLTTRDINEQIQEVKNKWSNKYTSVFKTWEENRDAIC